MKRGEIMIHEFKLFNVLLPKLPSKMELIFIYINTPCRVAQSNVTYPKVGGKFAFSL